MSRNGSLANSAHGSTHRQGTPDEVIALRRAASAFRKSCREGRLELFRQHLQFHVRHVNGLLAAVAQAGEVDLAAAAWRMRPPAGWCGAPVGDGERWMGGHPDPSFVSAGRPDWRLQRSGEVMIRRIEHPDGFLVVRPTDRWLELSAAVGGSSVTTCGGVGYLWLGRELPDTIALSVQGLPIGDIVSHPWLDGRDWPVVGVNQVVGGSMIAFNTGTVPYAMPWSRLLTAAYADHSLPIGRAALGSGSPSGA